MKHDELGRPKKRRTIDGDAAAWRHVLRVLREREMDRERWALDIGGHRLA